MRRSLRAQRSNLPPTEGPLRENHPRSDIPRIAGFGTTIPNPDLKITAFTRNLANSREHLKKFADIRHFAAFALNFYAGYASQNVRFGIAGFGTAGLFLAIP